MVLKVILFSEDRDVDNEDDAAQEERMMVKCDDAKMQTILRLW
jgi:hypothetical protein